MMLHCTGPEEHLSSFWPRHSINYYYFSTTVDLRVEFEQRLLTGHGAAMYIAGDGAADEVLEALKRSLAGRYAARRRRNRARKKAATTQRS